ncbi:MAG: sugar ABC transporter permease [Myxococcales bacterium]|nr:sugar ABC transporter permease [Myxococcales bacterium]
MVQVTGRPLIDGGGFPIGLFALALIGIVAYAALRVLTRGWVRVGVGVGLVTSLALAGALVTLAGARGELRGERLDEEASLLFALANARLVEATPDDSRAELVRQLSLDPRGRRSGPLLDVRTATAAALVDGDERRSGSFALTFSPAFVTSSERADIDTLWPWGLALAILGALVYALGATGQTARGVSSFVRHRRAYGYLAPALVGLLILVFIPVVFGIVLGFATRVYNDFQFAGLQNYVAILSDVDVTHPQNFYFTLAVTILWTVLNVSLHVGIGLFLALLLNDPMLKARGIFRVLLIVPWAVPNYITALIWKQMFHREFGAINFFLESLGFEAVSWFQSFWPAFFTNLATNTWLGFPFMMVVSLGALQSIPSDLYEAAFVDGASRWQRFKDITLPLLMPALVPAVIVGSVWTFNMFNIIYLVSGGAPNGATDILITEAFRWAFERDAYGYAAAYSTIIFIILLVFTIVTNRITGATKGAFE